MRALHVMYTGLNEFGLYKGQLMLPNFASGSIEDSAKPKHILETADAPNAIKSSYLKKASALCFDRSEKFVAVMPTNIVSCVQRVFV